MSLDMLTAPPAPTWHGFVSNGPDLYAQFMTKFMERVAKEQPDHLNLQLNAIQGDIARFTRQLGELRTTKEKIEGDIAELRQIVASSPTDDDLASELERLAAYPGVIGTRTDETGRLFVQFRIMHTINDKVYDLGDYELGFVKHARGEGYILNLLRASRGMSRHSPFGGYGSRFNGIYTGKMVLPKYYLSMGRLVEMLEKTIEYIVNNVKLHEYGFDHPEFKGDTPEQLWEGSVSNLLKAYQQSKHWFDEGSPEVQLRDQEFALQSNEARIVAKLETIRRSQRQLRETRAELRRLEMQQSNPTAIDRSQAHGDYEYIKSLPGVMGIRFNAEGIPIVHVRTSHVVQGTRFDLGDIELHLTKVGRNDSASVVKIRATRWHGNGGFYLALAGTGDDWFCFGTRASELRELFDKGAIREFLHIAINSLNAINRNDRSTSFLQQLYPEIPMDAVWEDRPPRVRRRRRSHLVTEEASQSVAV